MSETSVKLVQFSLRKLEVQEMETNENGGPKESLKVLQRYMKSIWGNTFGI